MKQYLALIVVSLLTFGCSTFKKDETCATATAAYATYLAVINAGGEPSKSEIQAAVAASAFLTSYCGYTAPPPVEGSKSIPGLLDKNGVPVLLPPGH